MRDHADTLTGVLLGTAVGDALGLPREGLSPRRAARLYGVAPLRHRFLFGRGMTSDDTEHTCLVSQALLRQPGDAGRFAAALGWGLRGWFAGLPAGIGLATLKACLKLWVGFGPARSGVWSAGNGPAMRSAILGACLGGDPQRLAAFTRACTRITHTDPKALRGATLVALAAHHGATRGPTGVSAADYFAAVRGALPDPDADLDARLRLVERHLAQQSGAADLAADLGLSRGVTGYMYHTVPIALFAWLRWPGDFRRAVEEVILLGGDSDTTGAIVGGLAGATCGASAIPAEWLRLAEWPRSVAWMRQLAARLAEAFPTGGGASVSRGALPMFWPALPARNLLFLLVVLAHALRRLLPPY